MEYLKREPLKSAPAPETTAFTMQSIQELLAEAGQEHLLQQADPAAAQTAPQPETPPVPQTAAAPATPPEPVAAAPAVQRPPQFPELASQESISQAEAVQNEATEAASRKQGLGQRIAGLFSRG